MLRPTHHILWFLVVLVLILLAAMTYQSSAAWLIGLLVLCAGAVSVLHTWRNLAGLTAEVLPPSGAGSGSPLAIAVVLRNPQRRPARAVELLLRTSVGDVSGWVDAIPAGGSAIATLTLPPVRPGRLTLHSLRFGSAWPCGLMLAKRRAEIATAIDVLPSPLGRPLPLRSAAGRDGEAEREFAGHRSWRDGDGQRLIDWKALARGRPLMAKDFVPSGQGGERWFDWRDDGADPGDAADPVAARAEQLTRRIAEALALGHRVGLRLPAETLAPDAGDAHLQACRAALARAVQAAPIPPRPRPAEAESQPLPFPALLLLVLAMGLGTALHAALLPWWLLAVVAAIAGWSLRTSRRGRRLQIAPVWRYGVLFGLVGALALSGRIGYGIEGSVPGLIAFVWTKMLELRTGRDVVICCCFSFFLAASTLLGEQGIGPTALALVIIILVIATLAAWHAAGAGTSERAVPPRPAGGLRAAVALLIPATVLAALAYLLVPLPEVQKPSVRGGARTGLGDHLRPGDIGHLSKDPTPAFRADFDQPGRIQAERLYWRVQVLWDYDGRTWTRGIQPDAEAEINARRPPDAVALRAQVVLAPNAKPLLPIPDCPLKPVEAERSRKQLPDALCRLDLPPGSGFAYSVAFHPEARLHDRPAGYVFRRAVSVPATVSRPVRDLAVRLGAERIPGSAGDAQVVQAVLEYFRSGGFAYTLDPGEMSDDPMGEFLLRRKRGFCEHYATGFALLLRLNRVPVRIVLGYAGGEVNPYGGFVTVRNADAHAWCEVWLGGEGWRRVDPTSVVQVIEEGTTPPRASAAGLAAAQGAGSDGFLAGRWRRLRQAWDWVDMRWHGTVIGWSSERRFDFALAHGLDLRWLAVVGAGLFAVVVLLVIWLVLVPRRHGSAAERWFARLSDRLAAAGCPRSASEGPVAYAARAAIRFPQVAEPLRAAATAYADLRYGRDPDRSERLKELRRAVRAVGRPR